MGQVRSRVEDGISTNRQ